MLDRNPLPAFVPSRFEHQPPGARFHTLTKAMDLGSTPVVWLISSQWHSLAFLQTIKFSIAQEDASRNPPNGSFAL